MSRFFLKTLVLILLSLPAGNAQACGKDTNCSLSNERHYRIVMPQGHDGSSPIGAIVWSHGYRGSAAGLMRNKSMIKLASELGVALVATKSFAADWRIPGTPSDTHSDGQLEFDYFEELAAVLKSKHNIDLNRSVSAGFSAGGMMVWNLICHRSQLFAAYIPVSGTFWEPSPATCDAPPTNVIHIHGDNDPVVPLLGRPIASTHQGKVPEVLAMYAMYGGYQKTNKTQLGKLSCQGAKNAEDKILDFCLFEGGHSFSANYIRQAWQIFVKSGALPAS